MAAVCWPEGKRCYRRTEMFSYLVDPVQDIDAVLVPADQPAFSQKAAEQP